MCWRSWPPSGRRGGARRWSGWTTASRAWRRARSRADRVEDALHGRADLLPGGTAGRPRSGTGTDACRAGQVEQVGALGLVQLQRTREGVQHGVGGAAGVAAFQPGVIVDADPGQQRDFPPAQPGHAAAATVAGQARLLRGDPGPPRGQEVTDLAPAVHALHGMPRPSGFGGPVGTRSTRHSPSQRCFCSLGSAGHGARGRDDREAY